MQASALRFGAGLHARLRGVRRRVAREDAVHGAPRVLEDGECLGGLLVVAVPRDLLDRGPEPCRRPHERLHPGPRALVRDLPRLLQLLGVLLDVPAAGVGELEDLAALGVARGDQPLVLQLLQDGVHRPRAGPPQATAACGQFGHHRVAVSRLLGEQGQDRRAHVAAPAPSAPAVTPVPGAGPARAEAGAAGPETGPPRAEARTTRPEARAARTEARAEGAAPAVPPHLVEHRVPHRGFLLLDALTIYR